MNIIVLSPDVNEEFAKTLQERVGAAGKVIVKKKLQPIVEIAELHDAEEKILALDPDFVNWKFAAEDIDSIQNLKAICLQTTSFSYIDVAHAAAKGIPVTNLRGFSTEAVAEFALMMLIGVARKMPIVIKDGFVQNFEKHKGIELKGKRVGIIGLGHIGTRFAELCQGIGMEVAYWSHASRDDRFAFVELAELFAKSDVVFPAMAKNEASMKVITDNLLASLKKEALFVSISHHLYNHQLVVDMVKRGSLYGYAFEEDNGNPAKYEGNILALPAIAWATDTSRALNRQMWTDAIGNAIKGEFPNKVN